MPLTAKDRIHTPSREPVYISSGQEEGRDDAWGQRSVVYFTLWVNPDLSFRANETGAYASSVTTIVNPSSNLDIDLLEEMGRWRDAGVDSFWGLEELLDAEEE